MLRRILGPKRGEVTGDWKKLNDKELNELYCSPNIIWVMKLRRMRWAVHEERMWFRKGAYRILVGEPDGMSHLEDPEVDGMIILSWIFRKWDRALTGFIWFRAGTRGRLL